MIQVPTPSIWMPSDRMSASSRATYVATSPDPHGALCVFAGHAIGEWFDQEPRRGEHHDRHDVRQGVDRELVEQRCSDRDSDGVGRSGQSRARSSPGFM
jgi:hypothetical protein